MRNIYLHGTAIYTLGQLYFRKYYFFLPTYRKHYLELQLQRDLWCHWKQHKEHASMKVGEIEGEVSVCVSVHLCACVFQHVSVCVCACLCD